MKRFLMVSFLILFAAGYANKSQADMHTTERLFFKANQLYFEGKFAEALKTYKPIVKELNRNPFFKASIMSGGEIFYNMGNCYYRMGKTGSAILNYERAKIFMPRDADLKYNLNYLKEMTKDEINAGESIINSAFFWVKSFSPGEIIISFLFVNFFLFLILSIRIFKKTEIIYYLSVLFLIIGFIFAVSLGMKLYQTCFDNRVVILNKEVNILAGPDMDDTLLFMLHEGTIADFERKESDFSLIRLPDGKRGWLLSSSVEFVMPSRLCE